MGLLGMGPFALFSIVFRTRIFFQRVREIEKADAIEVAAEAAYLAVMNATNPAVTTTE